MGSTSTEDWLFGWEPWEAPALEDLLPELSCEEQIRLQSYLREHERIWKWWMKEYYIQSSSWHTESECDAVIIPQARYALHCYNAKHPGEEFDVVKPLMEASVTFKGQVWYHVNFWARCRKNKKIKRFCTTSHLAADLSAQTCHFQLQELRSHRAPLATPAQTCPCKSWNLRSHPPPPASAQACRFHSQFPLLKHAPSSKSLLAGTGGAAHSVAVSWAFCTPWVVSLSVETTRTGWYNNS